MTTVELLPRGARWINFKDCMDAMSLEHSCVALKPFYEIAPVCYIAFIIESFHISLFKNLATL